MSGRVAQLSWNQIGAASTAWASGGSLALGAWATKHLPHFTVAEYGELVREVRDYLGDDTDYSQTAAELDRVRAQVERGLEEVERAAAH